jgi:hypothetical protein
MGRPRITLLTFALVALSAFGLGCRGEPQVDACHPNPCTQTNRQLCVIEEGAAVCLCNAGFLSRPDGTCEEVNANNCPEHRGDFGEPDDCMPRARLVAPGWGERSQSVDPIGDVDFFTFAGEANHIYTVTVKGTAPLFPRVDLFDRDGAHLSSAERTGQASLTIKIRQTSPNYYLRVTHSPIDASVAKGSYRLTLTTSGAEDHGDTFAEATMITANPPSPPPPPVQGRFEYPGDTDVFSFAGAAGTYQVAFPQAVPQLAIYLASNLSMPLVTASGQASVDFTLTSSEAVYLVLTLPGSPVGTTYSLVLTRP